MSEQTELFQIINNNNIKAVTVVAFQSQGQLLMVKFKTLARFFSKKDHCMEK